MGLTGNLRTMDLTEILQWIDTGRKTGTLYVHHDRLEKRIVFEAGAITTSWSNHPRESLGQFLIRGRHVTEEQLFQALLAQEREGKLIGEILIQRGHIDDTRLREVLRAKVEETVYDLFLWTEGAFEFRDGDVPDKVPIRIRTQVQAVLLEGIRRLDEWGRIRKVFPTMNTTFRCTPAQETQDDVLQHVLTLAARGLTLAEMSLDLRRSDFDTAEIVFAAHQQGLLAVERVEQDAWGDDPVGAIQDLLGVAKQRIAERRYDQAMKAYEQVLSLDRLNQNAKKGLVAVVEARSRDRAARSIPLDKVPVMTISLQALTRENFDPQEGFVLSRINGDWDIRSILKLCPMAEEDTLQIFARLLARKVIELR